MPPLKDELGPAAGRLLARELRNAWAEFPQQRFTRRLTEALAPLELLARADELTDRLGTALPQRFSEAAEILYRGLDSPRFTGWIGCR
jgi:hypothetical protein